MIIFNNGLFKFLQVSNSKGSVLLQVLVGVVGIEVGISVGVVDKVNLIDLVCVLQEVLCIGDFLLIDIVKVECVCQVLVFGIYQVNLECIVDGMFLLDCQIVGIKLVVGGNV